MLMIDETRRELVLDVDDDAVQWVNVLLETVKLLLLTETLPANWVLSLL
jgi:hypothetical protein